MKSTLLALLAVISLTQAPELLAQEAQQTVVIISEKSPTTAGLLSGLVFPGVGSFYAGNSGHGIRHHAIGLVSAAGIQAGSDNCGLVFSSPDDNCTLLGISAGVFIINWIWSITSGVSDAKAYNVKVRQEGLQVKPELVAIRSDGQTTIGLQLLRFGF
jgi:hypothetical protein